MESNKKSKICYVIGKIIFWITVASGISRVLSELSLVSIWGGSLEILIIFLVVDIIFRKGAKYLSEDELKQKNLYKNFLPKDILIACVIGLVIFVISSLILLLIPFSNKLRGLCT